MDETTRRISPPGAPASARAGKLAAYGVSECGPVRKGNEDAFAIDLNTGLFIVADGMGGHAAGEVASRLAVEAILAFVARSDGEEDLTWPFEFDQSLSLDANRLRTAVHLANRRVFQAGAAALPLPDASVDVVHARTAYFFGRGCEPGLAEAERVLRPGGAIAIVDLDATVPPYGAWMRADLPRYDPAAAEAFFADRGFMLRRIPTVWRFPDHATRDAVLRIEFSRDVAERAIHRAGDLELFALEPELLDAIAATLDRTNKWELSVAGGVLYLGAGGKSFEGSVRRISIAG